MIYRGICQGGPWDGRNYANLKSTMVLMRAPDGLLQQGDEVIPPALEIGRYQHDGFRTWIWVEAS